MSSFYNDNKSDDNKKQTGKSLLKELIIDICAVAVFAFIVWRFLGYGVWITSGSMKPTLEVKDRLIVSRVYDYDHLKYGDIVLFKNDEHGDDILIKRLIGRPGDKIEIKNGIVFRNGEKIEEDYVKRNEKYSGTFEVPQNKFFFLGDNRPNSDDARYWDNPYVDEENIQGKAILRYYPFDNFGFVK